MEDNNTISASIEKEVLEALKAMAIWYDEYNEFTLWSFLDSEKTSQASSAACEMQHQLPVGYQNVIELGLYFSFYSAKSKDGARCTMHIAHGNEDANQDITKRKVTVDLREAMEYAEQRDLKLSNQLILEYVVDSVIELLGQFDNDYSNVEKDYEVFFQ